MSRPITRSMGASNEAASIPTSTKSVQKAASTRTNAKKPNSATTEKSKAMSKKAAALVGSKRKRGTASSFIHEIDINELPHNLGKAPSTIVKDTIDGPRSIVKEEPNGNIKTKLIKSEKISPAVNSTPSLAKKATKKGVSYGLTPGLSPFPDYPRPTPEECEEANGLLSTVHGEITAPKAVPQPSLTVTGCGEVPSVLDALIRTLLSGATTGANSARAFQGLVQKFGILESGVGKGSVNWDAVRRAPLEDVFQAMKSGGLATTKSRYIKEILEMVYQENQDRRDALMKAKTGDGLVGAANETDALKQKEIHCANEHILSLDYIHALDKDQAMREFIKYPGIGPKTAACVILFCLQRPCFAVDTHIFRITKWLGWVPSEKINEITAFGHLDARIPDHLKYSLHQLLIRHGKFCPRCRAITGENSDGWDQGCVIDHLVERTGKRKGGLDLTPSRRPKPAKRRKREDTTDEDELSDVISDE
jgi:DNA-(apurinic or apyrimidinic site) lyase